MVIINQAVYSEESKIKLYTPEKESGHTIYNTIMTNRGNLKEKFIEIEANTLDKILIRKWDKTLGGKSRIYVCTL